MELMKPIFILIVKIILDKVSNFSPSWRLENQILMNNNYITSRKKQFL